MIAMLTVLLYLGLILEPRTAVQAGRLPKPIIWAEPGSVIAGYTSVTIWCQGSWEAKNYHLYKERSVDPWDTQIPLETRNKAKFNIHHMTTIYADIYKCYYQSAAGFSEHSDAMELVMTGAYENPSLSVWPNKDVTSGISISFKCSSSKVFGRFILIQEGKHGLSWTLDSQHQANQSFHATFVLDAVTPNHKGTFRCYGFFRNEPQVWSKSSNSLDLMISETKDKSSTPTEDGASVKNTQSEDNAELNSWNPHNEDPQGIVYAQVKPFRLQKDTASKGTQVVTYAQLCVRTQEQNNS
ncbi:leukocyte immunoglobulin-like receptor subfamily B member 4 isoform X2 [Mus pahari]|uniref:leukocyte immunoglobulin-like receptor subfamily B member 4 isoform X2 n=1 Tax=Mus pahari TaxID=10093 RepID=UPI000A30A47A|nr:leukocyte immunoglobulin-like receptor subfamily B member 4 isoform X2 [Mus pahari]